MAAGTVVRAAGVRKSYGAFEALRGIDLEIGSGEVFSLLGPNGAGKTTLVEIFEGYRKRSAGDVEVLGVDPQQGDRHWRAGVGVVLQNTAVFDTLTVRELVSHFASFYPAPLDVDRVIGMVGLAEKARARCAGLSGGQKRRADLAIGIVGDPQLVFLDEPTTGLDPQGRRQLWDVVRTFTALGKTIVLTTHYLDEAEALADRVGVIIRGRMAALGRPSEIGGRDRGTATVRFDRAGAPRAELPDVDGAVNRDDFGITIATARPTETVARLASWAAAHGVMELPGLVVSRPTLEEAYLAMVAEAEGGKDNG